MRFMLAVSLALWCAANWINDLPSFMNVDITDNGNFLFYNSPVSVNAFGSTFLAYVKNDGKVMMENVDGKGKSSIARLIHDHSDVVSWDLGTADDHAAPAIVFDAVQQKILIATAYHGSDLFIYGINNNGDSSKIAHLKGMYTYPRFKYVNNKVVLLVRKQNREKRNGDLVVLTGEDGFSGENVLVGAKENEVIYAGSFDITDDKLIVHYSVYSDMEGKLSGWYYREFSLKDWSFQHGCDLGGQYIASNMDTRPTGISVNKNNVLAAVSYFDGYNQRLKEAAFSKRNSVLILKGKIGTCDKWEVEHWSAKVNAPYYHTSVSINDVLDYIYFDKIRVVSNLNFYFCFNNTNKMYPNLVGKNLYYATVNKGFYGIRDFDNSIHRCSAFEWSSLKANILNEVLN